MNEPKNKKADIALNELISRQNYLVVQGNDLARAFGGLKAFEHRVLDYCFSCVTKEDEVRKEYEVDTSDILSHLGLNKSGRSYLAVANAFKALNEQTALYLPIERDGKQGIRMTQLFSYIDLNVEGKAFFKFGEIAAPLVFQLKRDYYSFHLHELSNIKSKYTLILMKLWQSNRMNNESTVELKGTMEDWQTWFLGEEKWPAGRFKQKVLDVATKELCEKQNCSITIETLKRKRTVEGYKIIIHKE